jgi:hypothetical protein
VVSLPPVERESQVQVQRFLTPLALNNFYQPPPLPPSKAPAESAESVSAS